MIQIRPLCFRQSGLYIAQNFCGRDLLQIQYEPRVFYTTEVPMLAGKAGVRFIILINYVNFSHIICFYYNV